MSILANDIYSKLIAAGIGSDPRARLQLEDTCAELVGETFDVDTFLVNLQYRGPWHYTIQEQIRTVLKDYNGETVRSAPRTMLNQLIDSANNRAAQVNGAHKDMPSEPPVWLTVYKDTLGYSDDHDNLTEICVPGKWLQDYFEADGTDTEEWFCEYTADDTEDIVHKAIVDGVILDCSNEQIRQVLLARRQDLDSQIKGAESRRGKSVPAPEHSMDR